MKPDAISALLGRALADFEFEVGPALWTDLVASGALAGAPQRQASAEWECLALHACVRGLVAAGGFGDETADAIDAMHERVLERWAAASPGDLESRREHVARRYAEYGRLGQERESAGPDAIALALGEAAAVHVFAPGAVPQGSGTILGDLHGAMAEGAAEVVRRCVAELAG